VPAGKIVDAIDEIYDARDGAEANAATVEKSKS
jgi:hypothetical protein